MANFSVADVTAGGVDAIGAPVRTLYAKYPPYYAVYQTDERVAVQYSDIPDIEKAQRAAVAQLNPIKGEINYLVEGWRGRPRRQVKALASDRRVADALIMACEGDPDGAAALLTMTRDAIIGERTSRARFYYLIIASLTAFAVTVLICSAHFSSISQTLGIPKEARYFLLGAAAGTQGAFFSIAIAMRQRTVLPDMYMISNTCDAVLRIFIGFMGAALLICLLEAKLVSFGLGGDPIDVVGSGDQAWLNVFAVGFVAGFSERLVPDLLERATVNGQTAIGPIPSGAGSGFRPLVGGAGKFPVNAASSPAPASSDPGGDADPVSDACLSDVGVRDHEATPDAALPPTRGGVAKS